MNCLYSFMSRFWATDGRFVDMVELVVLYETLIWGHDACLMLSRVTRCVLM